jgi:membrane protease YdiL (CAAX protease family)
MYGIVILKIITPALNYNQDEKLQLSVLILLVFGFFIYHFVSNSIKNHYSSQKKFNSEHASLYGFCFQRLLGFLTYGVIPFVVLHILYSFPISKYGFNVLNIGSSFIWIVLLGIIITIANYYLAGKTENLKNYPQIRIKKWTPRITILNSLTWFLYLFSYEFMFRGMLLFSFYYAYGIFPAVVVNCLLYSLVHIPKGKKETLGAIPLGIILSVITLNTGSLLTAFVFHVIMALSNDHFAIKAHPEMSFQKK